MVVIFAVDTGGLIKMTIINGSERFAWKKGYWINDGYGRFKNNKNKSSPGASFKTKYAENEKNYEYSVKITDEIIEKVIKAI